MQGRLVPSQTPPQLTGNTGGMRLSAGQFSWAAKVGGCCVKQLRVPRRANPTSYPSTTNFPPNPLIFPAPTASRALLSPRPPHLSSHSDISGVGFSVLLCKGGLETPPTLPSSKHGSIPGRRSESPPPAQRRLTCAFGDSEEVGRGKPHLALSLPPEEIVGVVVSQAAGKADLLSSLSLSHTQAHPFPKMQSD